MFEMNLFLLDVFHFNTLFSVSDMDHIKCNNRINRQKFNAQERTLLGEYTLVELPTLKLCIRISIIVIE